MLGGYTKNKQIKYNIRRQNVLSNSLSNTFENVSLKLNEYLDSSLITGEKIQNLADVYLGLDEDFKYNPFFNLPTQKIKQYNISNIGNNNENYDNPHIVFCYTHRIELLAEKIKFFKNNFILLTHNSDKEIRDNDTVQTILKYDKLEKWYAQNLYINNIDNYPYNKLNILPIGIANSQWKYNREFINSYLDNLNNSKDKKVYMSFNIDTNKQERRVCYNALHKKIPFLPIIDSAKNFDRMSKYQYCICPIGN